MECSTCSCNIEYLLMIHKIYEGMQFTFYEWNDWRNPKATRGERDRERNASPISHTYAVAQGRHGQPVGFAVFSTVVGKMKKKISEWRNQEGWWWWWKVEYVYLLMMIIIVYRLSDIINGTLYFKHVQPRVNFKLCANRVTISTFGFRTYIFILFRIYIFIIHNSGGVYCFFEVVLSIVYRG